jgi:hypothetical protein
MQPAFDQGLQSDALARCEFAHFAQKGAEISTVVFMVCVRLGMK